MPTSAVKLVKHGYVSQTLSRTEFLMNAVDPMMRARLLAEPDNQGCTPLFHAQDKKVRDLLISLGADVDHRNDAGEFLLMFGIKNGQLTKDGLADLSKLGFSIGEKTAEGKNIYPGAVKPDRSRSGFSAINKGSREKARILLEHGANPSILWVDQRTFVREKVSPMKLAVQKGRTDIVDLLIEYGAKV